MSYTAGEALILIQIQATSTFATANTSRGKYGILNKGSARQYCILRPGAFDRVSHGLGGKYLATWITVAEVWTRYKDDGGTMTTLEASRQEIIDRFDSYPRAADTTGTIVDVAVISGGELEEMWGRGGNGPAWLRQELTIEWTEEVDATLQE